MITQPRWLVAQTSAWTAALRDNSQQGQVASSGFPGPAKPPKSELGSSGSHQSTNPAPSTSPGKEDVAFKESPTGNST